MTYQAKVLTVSDSVMRGEREDRSGPAVAKALADAGFEVIEQAKTADGTASVAGELARMASSFVGLVVTTGGTGFAPRDLTPEGTSEILDRHAPGLAEAMRRSSPVAPLSRGIAGVRGHALVVNLPGSPTGSLECLAAIMGLLPHAISILAGGAPALTVADGPGPGLAPQRGTVEELDVGAGLGYVVAAGSGRRYRFHCTEIADGSRHVQAGTEVEFVLAPGHRGQWEARGVSPLRSWAGDAPKWDRDR